ELIPYVIAAIHKVGFVRDWSEPLQLDLADQGVQRTLAFVVVTKPFAFPNEAPIEHQSESRLDRRGKLIAFHPCRPTRHRLATRQSHINGGLMDRGREGNIQSGH